MCSRLYNLAEILLNCTTCYNRGGASEASGATLTGDVDGSSRYMYVCMYTCVKPLGQLLHAHAHMVLSQQFSKFIFTGKGNSGKKDLLLRSGFEPGSDALQTTALATEPMGLWQLWTANLALILLTAAVSVDYSEIDTMAMHQEKANRLCRHYKVCLLYSFS